MNDLTNEQAVEFRRKWEQRFMGQNDSATESDCVRLRGLPDGGVVAVIGTAVWVIPAVSVDACMTLGPLYPTDADPPLLSWLPLAGGSEELD